MLRELINSTERKLQTNMAVTGGRNSINLETLQLLQIQRNIHSSIAQTVYAVIRRWQHRDKMKSVYGFYNGF